VVVLNLTPTPHSQYRIGVPESADYLRVLSSDDAQWGGSGYGGDTTVIHADDIPYHGRRYSVELALPPLSATLLVPAAQAPTTT
jgi:1,4-alpha-glucan branching enzyme